MSILNESWQIFQLSVYVSLCPTMISDTVVLFAEACTGRTAINEL